VTTYNYSSTKLDELTSVVISGGPTTNYTYSTDNDGMVSGRGSDTFTWDGRQRNTGGTFGGSTVTYSFDARGFRRQRVSGTSTTRYLLGGLVETDGSSNITLWSISSAHGDLATYAGAPTTSNTVTYKYYSGHGDLAAEADQTGARTAGYTYDPFGALRSGSAPANATSERWVGDHDKTLDSTSGLIQMGARPYDPSTGRFYALDPVEGGSANGYDYAGQDPVNIFDFNGTAALPKGACQAFYFFIVSGGFTAVQAAGIVGNLLAEDETFYTGAENAGHLGIAQWDAPRWEKLKNVAAAHNSDPLNLGFQIAYVLYELTHDYPRTTAALRKARSVSRATYLIYKNYEAPDDNTLGKRTDFAERVLRECPVG
jgi:RHS repeat-associated protein